MLGRHASRPMLALVFYSHPWRVGATLINVAILFATWGTLRSAPVGGA